MALNPACSWVRALRASKNWRLARSMRNTAWTRTDDLQQNYKLYWTSTTSDLEAKSNLKSFAPLVFIEFPIQMIQCSKPK